MTAGILSSIPQENLVFVPRRVNGQLRPGERCIATGMVTQLDLPSPLGSKSIEVLNNTTTEVRIAATGGATISGNDVTTGTVFFEIQFVLVPVRGRAILTANGSNWTAVGCVGPLEFNYNGTPLATNSGNPLGASDLFHYLGIIQGGGTWTNPANTTQLVSAASAMESGTVANLTDRVTSGQNVYTTDLSGSWVGWTFRKTFTCTGFWFQTWALANSFHLRNFRIRVSDEPILSGQNISTWPIAQEYLNRTEVTGTNAYFYYGVTTPIKGKSLALQSAGVTSSGDVRVYAQEINLFGIY